MPGQVLIAGYQIGYRTKGIGGYTEPYIDLPMLRVLDTREPNGFLSAASALELANRLCRQLKTDFPNAEWRIVECWE